MKRPKSKFRVGQVVMVRHFSRWIPDQIDSQTCDGMPGNRFELISGIKVAARNIRSLNAQEVGLGWVRKEASQELAVTHKRQMRCCPPDMQCPEAPSKRQRKKSK